MPRAAQPAALKAAAGAAGAAGAGAGSSRAASEYPPAVPPPPASPAVAELRRDYRWAAISQFLFTFGEAFGLVDWDIENLEREIDDPEIAVGLKEEQLFPDIVTKLLYALTYDRTVNKTNFLEKLRTQYTKRLPRSTLLPADTPWSALPLPTRVQLLHQLCEWQLADPMRFRALLRSEEDAVQWRIEPCGWDREGNVYWLFDDNRLWVQHPPPPEPKPPKPPTASTSRKSSSKAAKSAARKASRAAAAAAASSSRSRSGQQKQTTREEDDDDHDDALTPPPPPKRSIFDDDLITLSHGRTRSHAKPAQAPPTPSAPTSRRAGLRGGPAAPPAPAAAMTSTRKRGAPAPEAAPESSKRTRLSTTRSTRRGRAAEEVWQEVPVEWLEDGAGQSTKSSKDSRANGRNRTRSNGAATAAAKPVAAEADGSDSELTALSSSKSASPEPAVEEERRPVTPTPEAEPMETEDDIAAGNGHTADDSAGAGQADSKLPNEHAQEQEDAVMASPERQLADEAAAPVLEAKDTDPQEKAEQQEAAEVAHMDVSELAKAVDAEAAEDVQGPPAKEDVKSSAADAVDPSQAEAETKEEFPANGAEQAKTEKVEAAEEEPFDEQDEVQVAARKAARQTWLEWECVCVSRYDWENFPLRFKGSKHVDEKAFYSYLVDNICPDVIAALRQKELEAAKQQAILNRKRSSRIQMKEQEKEEQLAKEKAQREMEERMQRARNEEARAAREEAERMHAEQDREGRLREREERLRQREAAALQKAVDEVEAKERAEREREERVARRENGGLSQNGTASPRLADASPSHVTLKIKRPAAAQATRPVDSSNNWELACEICGQHGWNVVDKSPMAGCELCGRWQHIACHDRQDDAAGRRRRDWEKVDFFCASCRRRMAREKAAREANSGRAMPVQHQQSQGTIAAGPSAPPQHRQPASGPSHHAYAGQSMMSNNYPGQTYRVEQQRGRESSHVSNGSAQRPPSAERPVSAPQRQYSVPGSQVPSQRSDGSPSQRSMASPMSHPPHIAGLSSYTSSRTNDSAQQHPSPYAQGNHPGIEPPRRPSEGQPLINGHTAAYNQMPGAPLQRQYQQLPAQAVRPVQQPAIQVQQDPRYYQQQQLAYAQHPDSRQQQQPMRAAPAHPQQYGQAHPLQHQQAMSPQQYQHQHQWAAAQRYASQTQAQSPVGPPQGHPRQDIPQQRPPQQYAAYPSQNGAQPGPHPHPQSQPGPQQSREGQQYYRQH